MTQKDRDRLVVLKKVTAGLITQKQASLEIKLSERQVRRMIRKVRANGDKAVIHGSSGRTGNRKIADTVKQAALTTLSQEVYQGFGPTLAAEYLASDHALSVVR